MKTLGFSNKEALHGFHYFIKNLEVVAYYETKICLRTKVRFHIVELPNETPDFEDVHNCFH